MNDEFHIKFYKQYLREPYYQKVLYICEKGGRLQTETGIMLNLTNGGGIAIHYKKLNGDKLTSIVFSEEQYINEYYRISEIAYKEHPEITRPQIKRVEESPEERAERMRKIEKELQV